MPHLPGRFALIRPRAFTLIELLIVVVIIAILAVIATVNFRLASDRALKSAGAASLKALGAALQNYFADHGNLPPADREAGPFMSHTDGFFIVGNGPAAGGSWDAIPWLLVEQRYVADPASLFCPRYLKVYRGGETIGGGHPRYHNFRYAYNSSAMSSGGHLGGDGYLLSGRVWMVRDLFIAPDKGWYLHAYPGYPADYRYPWGEGEQERQLEHALYSDFAVRTVIGGTNRAP